MAEEILKKVIELIVQYSDRTPEKITIDTTFEELDMDSLDSITLIADLEEAFSVVIPNETALHIQTVREAVRALEKAIR